MQLIVAQMHETYKLIFGSCQEQGMVDKSVIGVGCHLSDDKSVFAGVFLKRLTPITN